MERESFHERESNDTAARQPFAGACGRVRSSGASALGYQGSTIRSLERFRDPRGEDASGALLIASDRLLHSRGREPRSSFTHSMRSGTAPLTIAFYYCANCIEMERIVGFSSQWSVYVASAD
jgi:hypothetical protein